METIILGSDHAGFELKEHIKKTLIKIRYPVIDLGTHSTEPCDYPKSAALVSKQVQKGNSRGILFCGTGIGESIVANKFKGIRATCCWNEFTAQMSREHNNSNILCLGARVIPKPLAQKIVLKWLKTQLSSEERHLRRLNQMMAIEKKNLK